MIFISFYLKVGTLSLPSKYPYSELVESDQALFEAQIKKSTLRNLPITESKVCHEEKIELIKSSFPLP